MSDKSVSQTDSVNSAGQAKLVQNEKQNDQSQVPEQQTGSHAEPSSLVFTNETSLSREELYKLEQSHLDRFQRYGDPNEINKAIEYGIHALDLTPDGHLDLPDQHANLGLSYTHRFLRLGELVDLEKAIQHRTLALDLTPDGYPDLPDRHGSLGMSYADRFRRLGELVDLEKAILHKSRAIDFTPDGHPNLPKWHVSLGVSYTDRFRRLGGLADLEKSIEHKLRGLDSTHDDHPDLPDWHASLGVSYGDRFRRLADLNDLEKAIQHLSRSVDLTPPDHPDLPNMEYNLGVAYTHRFRRVGELDDIEKAIQHKSRALYLGPDRHPDLAPWHASLGVSYTDRFRRLGEAGDFEKAIQHKSHALDLTPSDHPDLPRRHANLGVAYDNRFHRLGKLDDLEKAIQHNSRALELTPVGHPDLPSHYARLGASYNQRFTRLRELDDLEKAIRFKSRAIELTPSGHPGLPGWHYSLGLSCKSQFLHFGELNYIEKAIRHMSVAFDSGPDGRPISPGQYFGLAMAQFLQYLETNNPSHLDRSVKSFRQIYQKSNGSPREKFQYALEWAVYASIRPQLHPMEAYQATIDLLPEFVWLGATTNQRYQDLSTAENLAVNAAFVAIGQSNYKLALEWLEHARGIVWNQSLMLHSPLEDLQSSYPELAAHLQAVSEQLHDAGSEIPVGGALGSEPLDPELVGQQRRRLAKEYNNLLAQARSLPGFEDLLRPTKADGLIRAAHNGPIVVIGCHPDRCDALVIIPGHEDIRHLSLPGFTEEKALDARSELETSLRRKGLRERGVKVLLPSGYKDRMESMLLALWHNVVKPILDFLGFKNDVTVDNLPHITWCPTGALSFLPLHAAGDYSQPRSRVFNYVISSYTPTITALLACSPSSLHNASRVLAIGQPNTPGRKPLPGTTTELACLETHMQNKFQYSQLIDDQAMIANVLDTMEQHDWVHLACHAHQNVDDPTKSGFFLHDGTLDLASINRRSFRNKGLAFLSACQTATGDEKLPDEAIHLASGMLMAGYSSVIGTMWSVVDADAPLIADKVYGELMKEGKVGNGEAGKALHEAVGALRDKIGEKEFGRWVPYIHIGR
ncbi:hypothetical protein OPQ81_005009 [Rhizoctonia solani]|nr:hypothetical protein OPQ81_005009 [Rhizoctonia solani]